ncbi:MAG: hypothetical protein CL832_10315 [Crocinitomicaceae bacterium]|nr:hypothetical protein [Crocinitomicaceae bacterium]
MLNNLFPWYINELDTLCNGIDSLYIGIIASVFIIVLYFLFRSFRKLISNFDNSFFEYVVIIFCSSQNIKSISYLFFVYIIETSTLLNYHFTELFFYWTLANHIILLIAEILLKRILVNSEDTGFSYLLKYTKVYILTDLIISVFGSFALLSLFLVIPHRILPISFAYILWAFHWIYITLKELSNISRKIKLKEYISKKLIKNQNPTFWDFTSIEYINNGTTNTLYSKLKFIIWSSLIFLSFTNSDLIIIEIKFIISIFYIYFILVNVYKLSDFKNLDSNKIISKNLIDSHKYIYIDYFLISTVIYIIYQTYFLVFDSTVNFIILVTISLYLCKDLYGYIVSWFFNKWLSKTINSEKINLLFVSDYITKTNLRKLSNSIIKNMGVIPYNNCNAFIYNNSKIELSNDGRIYRIEESVNESRHYIIINNNDHTTKSVHYMRDVFLIGNMLRNTLATFDIFNGDIFQNEDLDFLAETGWRSTSEMWQYFESRKIGVVEIVENPQNNIKIKKKVSDIEIEFMLSMCDEKKIEIDNLKGVFENLTYENHKINDLLFTHLESENKELISFINEEMKYSLFEISLLYRQFFELSDLASKFMALIDIAECILMYMLGIVTAKDVHNNFYWNNFEENNLKNISFGGAIRLLETWTNENKEINPVHDKLQKELLSKFKNKEILKKLAVLVKNSLSVGDGSIKTYKTNLSIFYFLSAIRNKTRGHGAPTKASFELVNLTFQLVTMMFYIFNKIPGRLYCITSFEGVKFNIDLNYGPCPRIFHVSEDTVNIHDSSEIVKEKKDRNEFFEKCKAPSNFNEPIWCFENKGKFDFFSIGEIVKINEGRTYLLSSKEKNKSIFVSHSTGDIIKPSYKKFYN